MWLRSLYYFKKSFDTLDYSPEQLLEFQEGQFREVSESARSLSFYRDHWKPLDVEGLKEISELPFLDPEVLRKNQDMSQALNSGGISRQTSGTTGNPSKVRFDEQSHDWLSALTVRTMYLDGYRPRKKVVQYWEGMDDQRSWLGRKLMPKSYIDPDTPLETQVEILKQEQPEVLQYFPQKLLALCKKINAESTKIRSPELVFTYGEILTEGVRNYIEETLDAEVKDHYATTEFGTVGWECPEGGYHILEDSVYPEILNEGEQAAPGETGEMVLTGLVNTETPLVRYRIGDIVEVADQECSCETVFKKIAGIRGRKEDVFFNSEDELIYPDQVVEAVAPEVSILFYQLVAENDKYVLKYVPNTGFKQEALEGVKKKLRSELSLMPLKAQEVEKIPESAGGKLNIVENEQDVSAGERF